MWKMKIQINLTILQKIALDFYVFGRHKIFKGKCSVLSIVSSYINQNLSTLDY